MAHTEQCLAVREHLLRESVVVFLCGEFELMVVALRAAMPQQTVGRDGTIKGAKAHISQKPLDRRHEASCLPVCPERIEGARYDLSFLARVGSSVVAELRDDEVSRPVRCSDHATCPTGRTSPSEGATTCVLCVAGQYCPINHTFSSFCAARTASSAASVGTACSLASAVKRTRATTRPLDVSLQKFQCGTKILISITVVALEVSLQRHTHSLLYNDMRVSIVVCVVGVVESSAVIGVL